MPLLSSSLRPCYLLRLLGYILTIRIIFFGGEAKGPDYRGTQADLTLKLPAGRYKAEWLNTKSGQIEKTETFNHTAGNKSLRSPAYSEDIALGVIAETAD